MRAMHYVTYGGPLALVDLPQPVAGLRQVVVRVHTASVNPVDWKMASGKLRLLMPQRLPCVPLADVAGEIVQIGADAGDFQPSMRVHARIAGHNGGACAEFAVVGVDVLAPMPADMSFEQAAGLPLAGLTALQGLRDEAGLPLSGATERVLVVGASGGVGHLAVQIAVAAGARVTGVCSAANTAMVTGLGAHHVIDYRAPNAFAGLEPFDIILDCVGGSPSPWLSMLVAGGRFASTMPGPAVIGRSLLNALSSKRVRPVMLKSNRADLQILGQLAAAGRLKVIVDSRFALDQLAAAWERSKSGRAAGKILINVN
ncbi:MAG: NAD(P)-dependent alcohol dehydrogenase [Myxococcales bacterium]|nr:NAD(P)-dependent alcohol dehydrogenase [Myxococcales bacterium]